MSSIFKTIVLLIVFVFISACTDESADTDTSTAKGHVWKGQTDQIDKAKEVESMMLDAAKQSETVIEQQTQ